MVKLSKVLMGLLIEFEDAGKIRKGIIRLTDGYTILLEIVEGIGWNSSNMWQSTTIPHHSSTKQYWNYSKSKDFKILNTPENVEILLEEAQKCIGYKIDNSNIIAYDDEHKSTGDITHVTYDEKNKEITGNSKRGTWTLFDFNKQEWCNVIESKNNIQEIIKQIKPFVVYDLKETVNFFSISTNKIKFNEDLTRFYNGPSGDLFYGCNRPDYSTLCTKYWTDLTDNIILESDKSVSTPKVVDNQESDDSFDFDKILISENQYFVLERTSSEQYEDQWQDSIPINHVYRASKDCYINTFGVVKDIAGSTTNGWNLNKISFNKKHSYLKLRPATPLEVYAYVLNDGPVNVDIDLNEFIKTKVYELYSPGTVINTVLSHNSLSDSKHTISMYEKHEISIDYDSIWLDSKICEGFLLRYSKSTNDVVTAKVIPKVSTSLNDFQEGDWVTGWHNQESDAEHLHSKPWQVGKINEEFVHPKYGTTNWNTHYAHLTKITEEQVLKWAVEEYPEGTKYMDADNNDPYEDTLTCNLVHSFVNDNAIEAGLGYIYYKGKWAEKVDNCELPSLPKQTFEIGKWYQHNTAEHLFIKPIQINYDGVLSEVIRNGIYNDDDKYNDMPKFWHLVEDLSVIQEFLPDGHVDKVVKKSVKKPYWKKVRCIKSASRYYTVGKIYDVKEDGWIIDNNGDRAIRLYFTKSFGGVDMGYSDFEEYIEETSTKHPFRALKVGDRLSDKVIIEWTKRGRNRISIDCDNDWTNYVSQVQGNREIVKLDYIKGKHAFQLTDMVDYVWFNAEGFEEFYSEYLRTNFLIERHKLSEFIKPTLPMEEYKESMERLRQNPLTPSESYQKPKFYDPHLDTNNLSMPSFDDK